jgi:alcohol dehydrogenase YqhD (iron-dependent ADH family)
LKILDNSVKVRLFTEILPDSPIEYIIKGIKIMNSFKADIIIAFGGGSAIDTAKAIAHSAANPTLSIWDMWMGVEPVARSLPIGSVLTIPAAGSEMSDSAVLTNTALGIKRGLNTPLNRPAFAVMNPELAMTLPREQLAYGTSDILMHTLDRYFTRTKGNTLTDAFAEALLRTAMEAGLKAFNNPNDYDAMSDLMWCSSVSHNGLTGLGAVTDFAPHKLGHEISAKYDAAHGVSLTVVWRAWAEYVCPEEPARFARFARSVFGIIEPNDEAAAKAGIKAQVDYFKRLNMPVWFGEMDGVIPADDVEYMAVRATKAGPVGNFKKLYYEDAKAIYAAANHAW